MDETEKLRVLLPHWIEHNGEHAAEFRDYAVRAGKVQEGLLAAVGIVGRSERAAPECAR